MDYIWRGALLDFNLPRLDSVAILSKEVNRKLVFFRNELIFIL